MKEVGYVIYSIYVVLTVWLLISSAMQWLLWRKARKLKQNVPQPLLGFKPFVSIQVPVYNERYVIEGLLLSLSQLHYPKDSFEIVVLDDSTDDTTKLIERQVAALRSQGIAITTVRRSNRQGYKAGALQENLPHCKGELIAIFDADFRPAPEFLEQMVPHFADEAVGIVQARWTHLNRGQNFLTRVQSYLLDTYFTVEQAGRQQAGYFSNFCGTAGIWRKQCIIDAGGWDGKVLSEDLDLSYRAQLKGWKMVYNSSVAVPAELPSSMHAFKIQQARWTKGIVQTLRKNGSAVAKAAIPLSKKIHAGFHLSSSFVFPCLFINSLLALPLLLLRHAYPEFIGLTNVAAIGGLNLIVLTAIFYRGVKGTGGDEQFTLYYPLFLVLYMALSVQNTASVLQGLFGHRSPFVRTPKFAGNKASATVYAQQKHSKTSYLESGMLVYFVAGIGVSIYLEDYFFLLLFLMMSCGLVIVIGHGFATWLRWPFTFSALRRRLLFLFPNQ
jgi:cellulose synthase/poly-beta-1,6-N-acetylglucosamine synthase-like glycosyltransferase